MLRVKNKAKLTSAALEVFAAVCFFAALCLSLILWQPGSPGWAFLIHLLTYATLVSWFFSMRVSRKAALTPFSLPEIILFLILVYAIINAMDSQVRFASVEMLPFYLDALVLFYLGAAFFARRFEGFFVILFLLFAGVVFLIIRLDYSEKIFFPGNPAALYRGKKMMLAAFAEYKLEGCGSGALPFLKTRYLPLGDRYPPRFHPGYVKYLAETGIVGTSLALVFILSLVYTLFLGKKSSASKRKTEIICFWLAIIILGLLLLSGLTRFHSSLPGMLFLFLPVSGIAYSLKKGLHNKTGRIAKSPGKTPVFVFIGLAILSFIMLLLSTPYIGSILIHFKNPKELETPGYGTRIRLARFLTPYHPEVHISLARRLRAKSNGQKTTDRFSIEAAYLRAIRWNPWNEQYYLELAHFLGKAQDYTTQVSYLEKGRGKCPGNPEIPLLLFRIYIKSGKRKQALDVLDSLKVLYPMDYSLHTRMARYYAEAGSPSLSRKSAQLARQIHPAFYSYQKNTK